MSVCLKKRVSLFWERQMKAAAKTAGVVTGGRIAECARTTIANYVLARSGHTLSPGDG